MIQPGHGFNECRGMVTPDTDSLHSRIDLEVNVRLLAQGARCPVDMTGDLQG